MMNKYIITGRAARLTSGILELTTDQAKARAHHLEALQDGRFKIVATVEFKQGEVIGFEGDLPKALADLMEPEQPTVKQPSNKKKSESASE